MKSLRSTSALATQLRTPCRAIPASRPHFSPPASQTRAFISNPFASSPQVLTASRILPYPSQTLYEIIADVQSYNKFLPFCRSSTVTSWSSPDSSGARWPEEAELVIGFDSASESFYSRVYCDGSRTVEAVSGETETTLSKDQIAHHNPRPDRSDDKARNATVLTHLLTRWSLRPFPFKPGPVSGEANPQEAQAKAPAREQTEVNLNIEYMFANPLYGTLSAAAAPKVAEKMIEAFETRVKMVMDGPSMGGTAKRAGAMEGVLRSGKL